MKKVLFTGKGTSGSWQCRGVQLGGKIGKVVPNASLNDCLESDVVVLVKRIHPDNFRNIINSHKPWIWDLVDLYPQPACTTWSKEQAVHWMKTTIAKAKPSGIIWPNKQMQIDCDLPGKVIYHHARQSPRNPLNQTVKTVGYEGSGRYLGSWREHIKAECKRRGWVFAEGIPIHKMDIVIAVRSKQWGGYVQHHWKSNVKLANAHGSGTPFIGQPESSYTETCTGEEYFIKSKTDLSKALDYLEPYETRKKIHKIFLKNTYYLGDKAAELRAYLETF